MKIIKVDYIDIFDHGYSWDFSISNNENERLSNVLDYLKKWGLINSLKEFAKDIGENSVGMNDLKKGRKKISIKHVINMNNSYSYINTDYILLGEGLPFNDEWLVKKVDETNNRTRIELDIEKAKDKEAWKKILEENPDYINTTKKLPTSKKETSLYDKLIVVQNELLEAKNEIIKLKDEIHKLVLNQK
ncbi:hypothetical protein ACFSKN_08160 [Mariniflexile gromovii]|uniref:Uncharacterized protein n=1 Tax=Mariniflexile gromovii TaxID=362523 RepID=A0ABS4BUA0_9FLAO|nr:hypothetical protein [Mariniflexile gromovii]MBP0904175.1 hypothetical protein [Mariniflexile gromovii]